MTFADPAVIVFPVTGSVSCPRVSSGINSGAFSSNSGNTRLEVSHTYGKRTRRSLRLTFNLLTADPLVAGNNLQQSATAYIVVDEPKSGLTVAQRKDVVDGLCAYLTATSGANIVKLLGGEN